MIKLLRLLRHKNNIIKLEKTNNDTLVNCIYDVISENRKLRRENEQLKGK